MLSVELKVNPDLDPRDSLEKLVEGTLKLCVREPELFPRLTNQRKNLVEIIDWIG